MKYRLTILGLLMTMLTTAMAQTGTDDIFIYLKDGKINAFPSTAVDSLGYSNVDLEGNVYSDPVVQEVWTRDSVYRIPLSIIDSISVNQPETIYSEHVKNLSPDYLPYITAVDSMSISFSNDLPHSLRIKKGDILVYDKFDTLFENGFAGKIVSISSGDQIVATCEAVTLGEIYDQYVAVGDYTIVPDEQSPTGYTAVPRKAGGIFQKLNIGFDIPSFNVSGDASAGVDVRATAVVHGGDTYIELNLRNHMEWSMAFEANGSASGGGERDLSHIPVPLPSVPLLEIYIDCGAFLEASLSGHRRLEFGNQTESSWTVIYENGKYQSHSTSPVSNTPIFNGEADYTGEVWAGVSLDLGVQSIGGIVKFGVETQVGPYFDFNLHTSSQENRTYEALRGSFVDLGFKIESKLKAEFSLSKSLGLELGIIPVLPRRSFGEHKYYLLPDFSKLDVTTDSKSITVKTQASKKLLLPCNVGLCIMDEEDNVVETFYHDARYDRSCSSMDLSYTFDDGLQQGVKYTVQPLVKWNDIDLKATPTAEKYLDCDIVTGKAVASVNSAEVNGSVKNSIAQSTEAGFVYSKSKLNLKVENASKCKAVFLDDKNFIGDFSGLSAGTTYYYRAFVVYNNQYFYGDTQCVTTKKDIDNYNDDNYGGDFTEGSKPFAQTGSAFDIEQKEAKIELQFSNVSPSTECGYYLEADAKKSSKSFTRYYPLGTVTGHYTVHLENLAPGTTYRYWAVEKNENGSATARNRTFKTEPSPDPIANILEVDDIEMKTATAKCYFENFERPENCFVEVTADDWTYTEKATPDLNGNAEVELTKLCEETLYTVKGYVEVEDEDEPVYGEESLKFETLGPDITGLWEFKDTSADPARFFEIEIREDGTTNTFFGVNQMSWSREGRNITLIWEALGGSTAHWEYRGEFNENYTYATGKAYFILESPEHGLNEVLIESDTPFYIRKK